MGHKEEKRSAKINVGFNKEIEFGSKRKKGPSQKNQT